jgi:phosphate/sulfate permease
MAPSPFLKPATTRIVGGLVVAMGILMALGLFIRIGVAVYGWSKTNFIELGWLFFNLLGLVASGLLVRYGRRLIQGGHLSDGPAQETML